MATIQNPQDILLAGAGNHILYNGSEYLIDISSSIKKSADGTTLTVLGSTASGIVNWSSRYFKVSTASYTALPCRFRVYENTTEIVSGVNLPTANTDLTAWNWTASASVVGAANLNYLKIEMYAAEGTAASSWSNLLNTVTIPVVQDGAAGTNAVSGIDVILDNFSHGIPTLADGTNGNYFGSGTNIVVYEGNTELIYDGFGAGTPAAGHFRILSAVGQNISPGTVTTSVGNYATAGTHANITADAAVITYTLSVTKAGGSNSTITAVQNFQRVKSANDNTLYYLINNTAAIRGDNSASVVHTPTTLSSTAWAQSGTALPLPVAAAFKILSSIDGTTFGTTVTSTSGTLSANISYTIPNGASIKAYKVELYRELAFTNLLDYQIVPILFDGTNGTNGTSPLSVQLTNDSHTIPTDSAGNNGNYVGSGTQIHVYEGITELTYAGNTTGTAAPSVAGQYYVKVISTVSNIADNTGGITSGAVTSTTVSSIVCASVSQQNAMTSDTATITYQVYAKSISGGSSYNGTAVQTFSKSKAGTTGAIGNSYWISNTPGAIKKNINTNIFTPTTIQPGITYSNAGAAPAPYTGSIKVLWGTDGITHPNTAYASVGVSQTTAITLSSLANVASLKVDVYLENNAYTSLIDSEVIPIVTTGTDSKSLLLTSDKQSFTFNGVGTLNPSPQNIVFTPVTKNLTSNTITWSSSPSLGTTFNVTSTATTNTMTSAMFSTHTAVTVTATCDGQTDTMTIVRLVDGSGAITGYLTNEAHVLPADTAGNVTSFAGASGTFNIFYGVTDITTNCTFTSAVSTGVTASVVASTGVYTLTGLSAANDIGTVTLTASKSADSVFPAVNISKVFSVSKSKTGAQGNSIVGDTGLTGAQKFTQYAIYSDNQSISGTDGTKTFNGTNPNTSSTTVFTGGTAVSAWQLSAYADAAIPPGYRMWQSDVLVPAGAINGTGITWGTPYISTWKVGRLSAIAANLGSVEVDVYGALYSAGKSYGSATAGFFLGYSSGAYQFDIGSSSAFLRWDGTNLRIGGGTASSIILESGTFAFRHATHYSSRNFADNGIPVTGGYAIALGLTNSNFPSNINNVTLHASFDVYSSLTSGASRVGYAIFFNVAGAPYLLSDGVAYLDAAASTIVPTTSTPTVGNKTRTTVCISKTFQLPIYAEDNTTILLDVPTAGQATELAIAVSRSTAIATNGIENIDLSIDFMRM